MDASLLGFFQVIGLATFQPLSRNCLVSKTHGTNGPCHIALATGVATRRIIAQQAPRCFLMQIHISLFQITCYLIG